MLTYGKMQRDSVFEFFTIELRLTLDRLSGSMCAKYTNILIERLPCYVMAIAMFVRSVTVYEISTVKIGMTLTLICRTDQGQILVHQSKANRRLPMYWQLQYLSSRHLRDIRSIKLHDLDFDL